MNVVLVDDDFINRLVLKKYFEKIEGVNCSQLTNGEELISYIEQNPEPKIDFIFLDLMMPLFNGFEFLVWFTQNVKDSNIKIIVLTSSIDYRDEEKIRSFECVYQFFQKPLTPEKLSEILN